MIGLSFSHVLDIASNLVKEGSVGLCLLAIAWSRKEAF